jgi:hypothetical protein
MRIDFVKSGGFAAPLRTVRGTVDLTDDQGQVTADSGYQRSLTAAEVQHLRAGVNVPALTQAAATLARSASRGAADVDHYHVTITDDDGAKHELDFNAAPGSHSMPELKGGVSTLLGWMKDESRKILAHRTSGS